MKSDYEPLSKTTIRLHWLVGVAMMGLVLTGLYMVQFGGAELYNWHKAIGVIVFLPIIIRVIWRIYRGFPSSIVQQSKLMETISKSTHFALLFGTLVMPLSGFLMSSMGGYGVYLWGIELVERRVDPLNSNKVIPIDEYLSQLGQTIHHWAGYAIVFLLSIHILGALKHHLIDKDRVLLRMINRG